MTAHGIEIGAVLAGRYRVERVLGQGGMASVVQAMHLQLQQPVAMKFLLPELLRNQEIVQRFLREAQAAVRLTSEHVARVIDVGTLETGAPYMVLEYLEGADLSSSPRSQLTAGGIVDLVLQACEALAEAHALGIVHRDIKPANLFLTRRADGTPLLKVLDFGISKISTAGGQLTATQTAMGTPAYMSPEQMRSSRHVDHRSDIWSLGVVLYELLQGAPPFGGDTFPELVLKIVNDPLPKLTVRLPGDLDAVVYRCLEKDPARRFQTIAELARALATYAQSETQAAISVQRTRGILRAEGQRAPVEPGPAHDALPTTISGAAGARATPRRSGRRWPIIAAIGVLAGGIVIAVGAVSGRRGIEGQLPDTRSEGTPNMPPAPVRSAITPAARPPTAPPPSVATEPPPAAAPTTKLTPSPVATPPWVATEPPPATTSTPTPSPALTAPSVRAPAVQRPDKPAMTQPARSTPHVVSPASPAVTAPPSTTARKPQNLTKRAGSPGKPRTPPAGPAASPDDDILGARK